MTNDCTIGFLTYHCAFEPVALNVHIIYLNRCQTQKMVATQKICTKLISTYLICYFCSNFLCTLCVDSFNLIYVIEFTQRFWLVFYSIFFPSCFRSNKCDYVSNKMVFVRLQFVFSSMESVFLFLSQLRWIFLLY